MKRFWLSGLLAILLILAGFGPGLVSAEETKTITDMYGREVTVPAEIDSVLSTAPPSTEATYMIAPDVLIGLNFAVNGSKYFPEKYKSLPNVGGQQMGNTLNYETFLAMNPDIVLLGFTPGNDISTTIETMETKLAPIPVVAIADSTNALNYGPEIEFLGELFGEEEQAAELTGYYDDVFAKVNSTIATIPTGDRIRVYYAEGADGLSTDPESSAHAQLITICGGENVADITEKGGGGMAPVTMEQVASWNPELILCGDSTFYNSVLSDPNWQGIDAVENKRVYLIPNQPFGWIDRPPGVNRIIGIPWLAKVLYPEKFQDLDLAAYIREFYSQFIHYDLTDDEVNAIITGSGL